MSEELEAAENLLDLLNEYADDSNDRPAIEPNDEVHSAVSDWRAAMPLEHLPSKAGSAWYTLRFANNSEERRTAAYALIVEIETKYPKLVQGDVKSATRPKQDTDDDLKHLNDVDRQILEIMPIDERYRTAKEIAGALPNELSYIQKRLVEKKPLRERGFIEKRPDHDGYRRLK